MPGNHISYESEIDYDAHNDTIYAFALDQDYVSSLVFGDIIMDLNKDNEFVGTEVLNASTKFNVSSYEFLSPVELKVDYEITDDKIEIAVTFTFVKRNQSIARTISATGDNDLKLAPASATLALA